jgi:shikimate dehydrogenase
MMHTGTTKLAGVLGWPVAHSLSPKLHFHWLRRYAIDGAYLPLPVTPQDFPLAVRGLAAVGFRGANVTVPHKQAAHALCDILELSAQRSGAVNTLVFDPARGIVGANTDGQGFLASLREQAIDPAAGPALILGAGGAARAIAAALLDQAAPVTISTRRDPAAHDLVSALPGVSVQPWPPWQALGRFALLINATSAGMQGKPALDADLSRAPPTLVVADIIYAPRETVLLAQARARHLRTVEGIGMLLHQAAAGFHAWFGVLPEVDAALRDFVLSG